MTREVLAPSARNPSTGPVRHHDKVGGGSTFWLAKRLIDVSVGISLMPLLAAVSFVLIVLNPWLNPGPLLARQIVAGKNLRPFTAIRFRSSQPGKKLTKLGKFIRRVRVEELPLALSVLRGEMSVIGPSLDQYEVLCKYPAKKPEYHHRHLVRPGISGMSQVTISRADGVGSNRNEVDADLVYVHRASFALDFQILLQTLMSVGKSGKRWLK